MCAERERNRYRPINMERICFQILSNDLSSQAQANAHTHTQEPSGMWPWQEITPLEMPSLLQLKGTRFSPKNTYTEWASTWKNAPRDFSSGRQKSKPQWDTTSHQWERGKLTRQETTNVGDDVEKGGPSCTVGGNVNWGSHSGKLCGASSKSSK